MASVDETVVAYAKAAYDEKARGEDLIRTAYRLAGDRTILRAAARKAVETAQDEGFSSGEKLRLIIETLNIAILETE